MPLFKWKYHFACLKNICWLTLVGRSIVGPASITANWFKSLQICVGMSALPCCSIDFQISLNFEINFQKQFLRFCMRLNVKSYSVWSEVTNTVATTVFSRGLLDLIFCLYLSKCACVEHNKGYCRAVEHKKVGPFLANLHLWGRWITGTDKINGLI